MKMEGKTYVHTPNKKQQQKLRIPYTDRHLTKKNENSSNQRERKRKKTH